MRVKIISYSKPSDEFYSKTGMETLEDLVAYCARVSNPNNQQNTQTAAKLIKYLIKNQHWSPLEMVHICLEIETTRDIARQILRHRSFSFQEFSQRYADPTKDLTFETREARIQDPKNRQNSIPLDQSESSAADLMSDWDLRQQEIIEIAKDNYNWAISNGIAKEVARSVLPEGMVQSRLYMAGTLRSWLHYILLRSANGTQLEHMIIAKECAKVISDIFPLTKELLEESEK